MKFDPMKPAPPVTRIVFFIMVSLPLQAQKISQLQSAERASAHGRQEPLIVMEKTAEFGPTETKAKTRRRAWCGQGLASELSLRPQAARPAALQEPRQRPRHLVLAPGQVGRWATQSFPDTSAQLLAQFSATNIVLESAVLLPFQLSPALRDPPIEDATFAANLSHLLAEIGNRCRPPIRDSLECHLQERTAPPPWPPAMRERALPGPRAAQTASHWSAIHRTHLRKHSRAGALDHLRAARCPGSTRPTDSRRQPAP